MSNYNYSAEASYSAASNNNNNLAFSSVASAANSFVEAQSYTSGMALSGYAAQPSQSTVNQIASDLIYQHQGGNRTRSSFSAAVGAVDSYAIGGTTPSQAISSYPNVSSNGHLSEIEAAILRSTAPIEINETEEIEVHGQRGIFANRAEVANWRGVIPISQYAINQDSNPEVITKRSDQQLQYIQELAIRYLRPPTPPPPGEIVITQEANTLIPPAPPVILRQQPPRPVTPEPLVIREAPPQPPPQVGRKVITISGKSIPPAPRKVVIERLAPIPSKPQAVLIERWLPYAQSKRRVIFQRTKEQDAVVVKPRNVIVQWEAPKVQIKRDYKYLGVVRANPADYVARYGSSLKTSQELPQFVLDIKPPQGVVLAADYQYNNIHELEGDVGALKLVDLDREGLSQYRAQVQRWQGQSWSANAVVGGGGAASALTDATSNAGWSSQGGAQTLSFSSASPRPPSTSSLDGLVEEIFASIDINRNGKLSVDETEKVLLRLNSRLGRSYGEDQLRQFFAALDLNNDGTVDLSEFKRAFIRFTV